MCLFDLFALESADLVTLFPGSRYTHLKLDHTNLRIGGFNYLTIDLCFFVPGDITEDYLAVLTTFCQTTAGFVY